MNVIKTTSRPKNVQSTQISLYASMILRFVFVILLGTETNCSNRHPIVIMMGFDGLRPDYVARGLTPTLEKIMEEGVSTDYLKNIFPTKTMTNFFSIATGMFAENHGVLGNTVFNKQFDGCVSYSHELFHYNEDILPIWTLNEITGDGRYSGTMMWASSEYEFRNVKPTYYQPYNQTMPWQDRVNTMMSWLLDDEKPINLLCAYFEQPDVASHSFGTNSLQVNEQLERVEDILKYFLTQLSENNLDDKVNLIILSDHGMVDVNTSSTINVSRILNNEYTKCGSSPVLQITATPGKEVEMYQNLTKAQSRLKTFRVYKREEIPERWHFKNNERNTNFLLVANLPNAFDDETSKADHGYDNEEKLMHAFFAAKGPAFRKRFHASEIFWNIDVYALISYILRLDPSLLLVKPNGTLSNIITILDDYFSPNFQKYNQREILKYFISRTSVPRQIDTRKRV